MVAALSAGWGLQFVAQAASDGQAQSGFGVSPFYQNVSLGEHQAQAHYTVTLTNNTASDQSFKLSTMDFGSLNDSGGVAFLGSATSSYAKKYGLAAWMKLDADTVTVPQGKEAQIGVSILNADSLTAGGHYGAILATALTAPNGQVVRPQVGVFAVLSSLILLVKQGGAPPALSVTKQASNGGWWRLPSLVTDQFSNDGGVHVVPRGLVEVRDPMGRVVERGAINEDSGIILPQMERKYVTPLLSLASARIPGTYTVVLSYRFDGAAGSRTFRSSYLYLGPLGLAIIGLVVALVLGSAGYLVWRHRVSIMKRFSRRND